MGPLGIPELIILALPLLGLLFVVILVLWLVKRSSKKSASPAAQPAPYHSNISEELLKLSDLLQRGQISQDEFLRMKNELINRMSKDSMT